MCKNGEKQSTASTLLGLLTVTSWGEFSCVWLLPSKNKEGVSEAASVKCQGREVGGIFIPILQLGRVSSNKVMLLAKGHPEVRASEEKKKLITGLMSCSWVV